MLVDETISLRKENAEIGARMIPADDPRLLKPRIHFLIDLSPRFMREGNLGIFAGRTVATNEVGNDCIGPVLVGLPIPDKHPADFDRRIRLGVLLDAAPYFGRDVQTEIGARI